MNRYAKPGFYVIVPGWPHLTIRYHTLWLAEEQKAVLHTGGYWDVVIEVVGPLCGFGDGDYDDWNVWEESC